MRRPIRLTTVLLLLLASMVAGLLPAAGSWSCPDATTCVYTAGRGVLVEALDALAARTRAETNVIQALYEYNVAQDQLRRAIGQPESAASSALPGESMH